MKLLYVAQQQLKSCVDANGVKTEKSPLEMLAIVADGANHTRLVILDGAVSTYRLT